MLHFKRPHKYFPPRYFIDHFNIHSLKVPPQFDFVANFISNKFYEKPTYCNMLARLCSFCIISKTIKLLNYCSNIK